MATNMAEHQSGFLLSKYPVSFPSHQALFMSEAQFQDFLKQHVTAGQQQKADTAGNSRQASSAREAKTSAPSALKALSDSLDDLTVTNVIEKEHHDDEQPTIGLDIMLTENGDVTYRSTTNALVDCFAELEDVVSGPRLHEILEAAWREDSLMTLKIIFNARSIHIGKSSRSTFYRCAGWLAQRHPFSLLVNLQWLSRPVIEKKLAKKEENEDDPVLVEAPKEADDPSRFDVKDGVAHGYYKDLLNILVLAVNNRLDVLTKPRDILNYVEKMRNSDKVWDADQAREKRRIQRETRHSIVVTKFQNEAFYKVLHITIARIFASQLAKDLVLIASGDPKQQRQISLCAKWAPTHKLFHDKHTLIVSSIAEILHPQSAYEGISDREIYLRHAREAYRKDVAALRKALEVVERNISAETFPDIKYDRVPSLAMDRYIGLFAAKDTERFKRYISNVAEGKKKISGAVLLPSTIIHKVRSPSYTAFSGKQKRKMVNAMVRGTMEDIDAKAIDGQWKTLVQRIRDSGTLSSSIAVCDVSGSMTGPVFPDGTTPMDSAIGLSLLVAEVTAAPFGGRFMTFSSNPTLQKIDRNATLQEKVGRLESSNWEMSTDFVAVFEKLILPEAKLHKVKPEDMVKTVFVFSDMQFNEADYKSQPKWYSRKETPTSWSSSFERIQKQFKKHGYAMPRLVFWNLAGGRAGNHSVAGRNIVAPKPVTADQPGTALVSGYSQGLLKMFLDNGGFEEAEEAVEEEIKELEVTDEGNAEEIIIEKRKKVKMDPFLTVKKAVSHKAYDMLEVVD